MNPKLVGKRIKELMNYKGIKRSYVAKAMGISYNTLTNKLNGKGEFSAIQIVNLKSILEIDDNLAINIFFNPDFKTKNEKIS